MTENKEKLIAALEPRDAEERIILPPPNCWLNGSVVYPFKNIAFYNFTDLKDLIHVVIGDGVAEAITNTMPELMETLSILKTSRDVAGMAASKLGTAIEETLLVELDEFKEEVLRQQNSICVHLLGHTTHDPDSEGLHFHESGDRTYQFIKEYTEWQSRQP